MLLTAALAALSAAVLYGTGAALQQHQAAAVPRAAAGRPSLLLLLARRPWWVLGISAELAAFSVHAFALRSGPLTVVQMLTASSLIFSVVTVRLWSGRRLGWTTWGASGAVVAGIGAFVALTGPAPGHGGPARAGAAAACLAVSAAPFAVTGLAAVGVRRAALLAVAAGLADACIAVVTMAFTHTAGHGLAAIATSWATYALAIGGPGSLLLTQTAYQAGRPMVTLPIATVVSPVASLAVGRGLLGEASRMSAARGLGAGLAVLVTAAGLAGLARLASAGCRGDEGTNPLVGVPDHDVREPPRPSARRPTRVTGGARWRPGIPASHRRVTISLPARGLRATPVEYPLPRVRYASQARSNDPPNLITSPSADRGFRDLLRAPRCDPHRSPSDKVKESPEGKKVHQNRVDNGLPGQ